MDECACDEAYTTWSSTDPPGPMARGDQGSVGGVGGGGLDDASAPGPVVFHRSRQAEEVDQPVHHLRFDLRSPPGSSTRACPGSPGRPRRALAEDRRRRGVGGEVGEPARRLPVRDPRKDDLVQVPHHRLERLRALRVPAPGRRDRISPGSAVRDDGPSSRDTFEVVGYPVDHGAPMAAELVRGPCGTHSSRVSSQHPFGLETYPELLVSQRLARGRSGKEPGRRGTPRARAARQRIQSSPSSSRALLEKRSAAASSSASPAASTAVRRTRREGSA